jgi:hypothetical protein
MNISYEDARDATMITNASNIIGVANTMENMLMNAIEINLDYLGEDVACFWALGHIRLIIAANENVAGLYPISLRQEVFMHIKALYQMAYRIDHRNAAMSYPPLTIAAQVLANITANASYGVGKNRRGLVSHEMVRNDIDSGIPSPFSGELCGEYVYVNWYSDAFDECLDIVRKHEEAEAAKTDEERSQEANDCS